MSKLKKGMKYSLALQSIWLLSLIPFPYITPSEKKEGGNLVFYILVTTAFLGGFGCGIYSKLSIELTNLS